MTIMQLCVIRYVQIKTSYLLTYLLGIVRFAILSVPDFARIVYVSHYNVGSIAVHWEL